MSSSFVCLHRGHLSREYRSRLKCSKCSRRHHASISLGEFSGPTGLSSQGQGVEPSGRELNAGRQASQGQEAGSYRTGLNADAPPFFSQNTTSLYVTTSKMVLLQTAQAFVCNPRQPAIRLNVRVVLDTGSQHSYITQQAARALALKAHRGCPSSCSGRQGVRTTVSWTRS